jgi:hypothetical protein
MEVEVCFGMDDGIHEETWYFCRHLQQLDYQNSMLKQVGAPSIYIRLSGSALWKSRCVGYGKWHLQDSVSLFMVLLWRKDVWGLAPMAGP